MNIFLRLINHISLKRKQRGTLHLRDSMDEWPFKFDAMILIAFTSDVIYL